MSLANDEGSVAEMSDLSLIDWLVFSVKLSWLYLATQIFTSTYSNVG